MRLITRFELAARSNAELATLKRSLLLALGDPRLADWQRRNALASLENIARERAGRAFRP